jgi:excisionase family DNA binding protein
VRPQVLDRPFAINLTTPFNRFSHRETVDGHPAAERSADLGPCPLLTLKQIGARTGLSLSSICRAIRDRRLAVHRLGRVLRVSEADLQALLKRCRRAAR